MRIALLGNTESEWSTENDILKSLIILGHDVRTVHEATATLDELSRATSSTRLLIWMHTHGWNPPITEQWLRDCDGRGCKTVGYTLDLFRGLKRHDPDYVTTHPWFKCKHFVQPDDPQWLIERGVNAHFMPPAILKTSCYLAPPFPDDLDIIFVGSENYHPEWPWRQEMLAFLRDKYGSRFHHFDHSSGMRGHRLNRLYATAKVVVGDSCFADPGSPYTSDRLFETLGRGGNLVYPSINLGWDNSRYRVYYPGSYQAGDTKSLAYAIDRGLELHEQERNLRLENTGAVKLNHTYCNRLQAILDMVAR